MKIAVIHGQQHQGSTYHITHMLLEQLPCEKKDIQEFYVNHLEHCVGCVGCVMKGEQACPHHSDIAPIAKAMEAADVIVINSPTYCLSMSGQLKTFFDHMCYRFMNHRPHPAMKDKIGIAISTTAGAGANNTTAQIAKQLSWWNVGKIYQLPFTVSATSWEEMSEKKKEGAKKRTGKIAKAIPKKMGHVKPGVKQRFLFFMMKQMQKGMGYSPADMDWWKRQGWL